MKTTAKILGLLSFSFTLAACDSGGAEYVKAMEDFADKACACKDAECTTKVTKESAEWLAANTEKASKLDAKDAEKVGAATTKMTKCMTEAATAAVPK